MAAIPGLGPTAHIDTFTRDNLPPFDQWPQLLMSGMSVVCRTQAT